MPQETPRCPICGAPSPQGKYSPFCSSRCQLIDLGNWLGERYVVPAGPADDPDRDPAAPTVAEEGEEAHHKDSR